MKVRSYHFPKIRLKIAFNFDVEGNRVQKMNLNVDQIFLISEVQPTMNYARSLTIGNFEIFSIYIQSNHLLTL